MPRRGVGVGLGLAFGLAVAAVGVGGLSDLAASLRAGPGGVTGLGQSAVVAGVIPQPQGTGPGAGLSGSGAGERQLLASTVQPPATAPSGAALPGPAEPARGDLARAGDTAPFRPTMLRLPSGSIAEVLPAGVLSDGALAIPGLPTEVGWWTGGALAGEPFGNLVLAGHVDTAEFGLGVLAQMHSVAPGATLIVSDGTHAVHYRVLSTQQVPKARLTASSPLFAQTGPHRLIVITCGGPFDVRRHSYLDNLVTIAEQLPVP